MNTSATQSHRFVSAICRTKVLWSIEDAAGFPAPKTASGHRAMPFWSTLLGAKSIVRNAKAYAAFAPVEIPLEDFMGEWLPRLHQDGLVVGIDWSGARAVGFDIAADALLATLRKHLMT